MSAPRNQLRAIVELTGLTPLHVAECADIPIKRINESLGQDWPMPNKYRPALLDFTKRMLRQAHSVMSRTLEEFPELRQLPGTQDYLRELDDAYVRVIGCLPADDTGEPT